MTLNGTCSTIGTCSTARYLGPWFGILGWEACWPSAPHVARPFFGGAAIFTCIKHGNTYHTCMYIYIYTYTYYIIYLQIDHMSYGRNYLFGGMPSPNVGGVPYRLSGFWMFGTSTSKQKHAIYIVGWCDLLHDRENTGLVLHGKWIAGEQVKMHEFLLTANANNW